MDHKHVKKEPNAISSSFRSERPGNYLFKIETFSSLLEALLNSTDRDTYDSCHFDAGGYKWKLSLYPNGDEKRGGDGYISLYLSMADPKSLPRGKEVHVIFKFFVYDSIRDSYLVLQDGKERRFHAFKTEWGFAKLLSCEIFDDPSQGYLVDDCCWFGVEMFIHTNENKGGSSLAIDNVVSSDETTFTWKIDKFSTLPNLSVSDVFNISGRKWSLKLYPKGDSRAKGKSLSLFLGIHDHSTLPCGWKLYVEYKLTVLSQLINEEHLQRTVNNCWFSTTITSWGYLEFMQLSDLKDASRGFMVNDTVIVEVEIIRVSVINSLP